MSGAIARLNAALPGRYRVELQLGEGGMATVYLADDLRHARKVALKVLKPELAAIVGADRFLAEIKTTAGLQHPNILPLFDSGEADGLLFYVMPLVEGDSLRERLDLEHQLPVAEAVRIAADVAHAVDYAHRHGVVHRDIKPANILLHDGRPIVSDFGIALAVSAGGAGRLTETGLSLGTPHYMSPEQATGDQHVGPATDIWALGCVLHEMLAGEPPYTGSTPQAVLGRIITGSPDPVSGERKSVPPHVDAVIARALEKVPADRFSDGKAFAAALADPAFRHGEVTGAAAGAPRWRRTKLAVGALAVAAAGLAVGVTLTNRQGIELTTGVVRFTIPLPAAPGQRLLLTPDQRTLVLSMGGRLYRRPLSGLELIGIPGTERAFEPFLSPDGEWVGYFDNGENVIKRVRFDGSGFQTVAPAPATGRSGGWSEDGTIVFNSSGLGGLYRVPASGGEPELIESDIDLSVTSGGLAWLDLLPGGAAVIGGQSPPGGAFGDEQIFAVPFDTGQRRFLIDGTFPKYVDIDQGYLMFWRRGSLWMVAFDPKRLELTGSPSLVAEGVFASTNGAARYAASQDVLVYLRGGIAGTGVGLPAWADRSGTLTPVAVPEGLWQEPRVSPDGTKIALARVDPECCDIWIHDLVTGTSVQLTFDDGAEGLDQWAPVWAPDGSRLVYAYSLARSEDFGIFSIAADGSSAPQRLTSGDEIQVPYGFTMDGRTLIFAEGSFRRDVFVVSTVPGSTPQPLLADSADEANASVSPNGQFVAYESTQPGYTEIYVATIANPSERRLVSTLDIGLISAFPNADPREGRFPVWSKDGRQLFYRSGQALVSIPMDPERGIPIGPPSEVFRGGLAASYYDVTPDGRRFAVIGSRPVQSEYELVVVENWFEEVRERLAN